MYDPGGGTVNVELVQVKQVLNREHLDDVSAAKKIVADIDRMCDNDS